MIFTLIGAVMLVVSPFVALVIFGTGGRRRRAPRHRRRRRH